MEAKIYNQSGKEVGQMPVPAALVSLPWNPDLVQQVIVAMRANQRHRLAATRGRGEVSGGGRKPWQQKGTGRARHGSSRSPLWRGGGVTHGPTAERSYFQKINKRMRARALFTVLAQKLREAEVVLVDRLTPGGKTKAAQTALKQLATISGFDRLAYKTGRRALIALPEPDQSVTRSFRNLASAELVAVANLDPLNLLTYRYLVLVNPTETLPALAKRLAKI